ncbi:MAG: formylglycine-generating enzyme family protein [Myxococcales bacterium]|nr:formylglycine-generating enzyme family protein [Myxococcales bacterium]
MLRWRTRTATGIDDADPSATGQMVWYPDGDGDGSGTPTDALPDLVCDGPAGYADNWRDCDDARPDGASSVCVDYTTAYGGEMIAIASGTFVMGKGSTYLTHDVTLTRDFWIGRTELTRTEWERSGAIIPYSMCEYGDCPLEGITWYEAAIYCNALSTQEHLTPCYLSDGTDLAAAYIPDPYSCPGYRLPTEAEWEYAARAGEDWTYAGSDIMGDVAWTHENSGDTPRQVCELDSNAWGLCDMSGNVQEWANDWYDSAYGGYGDAAPQVDPPGSGSGSKRVHRGGYYESEEPVPSVYYRSGLPPEFAWTAAGFRLARTVP